MRALLYALFFVSGALGLVYELLWLRLFSGFFGVTLHATTAVIAAFLGGLALGAWRMGRRAPSASPLRTYAWLEVGIGVSALAVPFLVHWVGRHYAAFGFLGEGAAGTAVRFAIAAGVLLVPTTLMGATLPVLARCLSRRVEDAGAIVGRLYAVNTFGAVAGVLVATLVTVPKVGINKTHLAAVLLNLSVGAVALWASKRQKSSPEKAAVAASSLVPRPAKIAAVVVAASGFAALSAQVVWFRVVAVITEDTVYAFGVTLAAFLAGIGLGAEVLSRQAARAKQLWAWLGAAQVSIGCYLVVSPTLFRMLQEHLGSEIGNTWAASALLVPFGLASLTMYLPTFLMGATLPLAVQIAARAESDVARATGRIYACNTVGAIVGVLFAGLVAIPFWGLRGAVVVAALTSGAASLLAYRENGKSELPSLAGWAKYLFLPGIAVGAFVLSTGASQPFFRSPPSSKAVVFEREDSIGLVEVFREQSGILTLMSDRTHLWGSTAPRMVQSMRLQGYMPLLLHPSPKRVLEVGLGTGVQLGPAAIYDAVEHVQVVEISGAMVKAARHFSAESSGVLDSPKTNVAIADGRHFLRTSRDLYDVIVLGLFVPYRPSAGYLFTREMYATARARLEDGGLLVHWLPLDQLSPESLCSVMVTFLAVFPDAHLWEKGQYVALIGPKEQFRVDYAHFASSFRNESILPDLEKWELTDPLSFLASALMGPEAAAKLCAGAPQNTEDDLRIEFSRFDVASTRGKKRYRHAVANLSALLGARSFVVDRFDRMDARGSFVLGKYQEARRVALEGVLAQTQGEHAEAYRRFRMALKINSRDAIAVSEIGKYHAITDALEKKAAEKKSAAEKK